MSFPPLEITDLHKRFGTRAILDGFSLVVAPAEVVRISGANGTGKTTLLACVAGTLIPDQGEIHIAGHELHGDPISARQALRYLPQTTPTPRGVSGRELLEFYADLYGATPPELDEVAQYTGLDTSLDEFVTSYSGGMKRRLMLAALRFGRPHLVVLDEPLAGVDQAGRASFRTQIDRWISAGVGVILTTHDPKDPTFASLPVRVIEVGRQ